MCIYIYICVHVKTLAEKFATGDMTTTENLKKAEYGTSSQYFLQDSNRDCLWFGIVIDSNWIVRQYLRVIDIVYDFGQ